MKNFDSGDFAAAVIFLGFFALVGFAVWWTNSPWALLGLLLAPSIKTGVLREDKNSD